MTSLREEEARARVRGTAGDVTWDEEGAYEVGCRKCDARGRFRQLILVVSNDRQQCQKVVTGNFHCPEHEFPESAAGAVAQSQWSAICRNFRTVSGGLDPIPQYTRLFYWRADEDIPPLDVHHLMPA